MYGFSEGTTVISRRIRTTSAAATLLTAVALTVPTAAWATASAASGTAPAAPTATPVGARAAAVVLPTGDRLVVGTGANAGLAVDQAPGSSSAFASVQVGGDRYVIPSEAAPYVGRSLDLSLFDVTKLAAAGTPSAHIPVQLTFAAGVTPTAPAGVTFTSVSGQSATGYLTPDSGKAFAQALRDSIKADLAAGHKAGTAPLFGGLTSMAVPGVVPPVQPFYPLHILQVNTLDSTGAPSGIPIILVNTDNAKEFDQQLFSSDGIAKVAVPAGNYAAIAFDFTFEADGTTPRTNIVSQDGISVPATGTVPVATIDERTATSKITFTTQKPSTSVGGYVAIDRVDPNGIGGGLSLIGGGDMYITPEAKPATGSLDYVVNYVGESPATAASQYRYNLAESSDQIAANQTYAPADSSLATLRHTFNLDPAYGSNEPDIGSAFATPIGWTLSGIPATGKSATEYVTGGLQWFSEMFLPMVPNPTNPIFSFAFLDNDGGLYRAGQVVQRTWAYAPEAPNFGQHSATPTGDELGCQACSGAGNLNVTLGMLGDSNRDTTGMDFTASGASQLYWNGQLVSSDTNHFGYTLQNVSGPGTVRTVFDYDRTPDGVSQSSKTHTDVTIPYSGETDPSLALPSGIDCVPADIANTPTAPCQILPALTLNYQLNALSDSNTSHAPVQNLVLHVGHLSYGTVGSRAHIDSAQVSVSFDNGATWRNVPTHGADGIYDALWRNPAAGSPVELRVTATDCLGGSITQTVTNPYTVG